MSELNQQIWEYVYDLLPEDQVAEMRERICSDPDAARAYATAILQAEVVAQASRIDAPAASWRMPDEDEILELTSHTATVSNGHTWRTMANWFVASAAAALLCVMLSPLVLQRPAESPSVAATVNTPLYPVHTTVSGPSKLNREVSNPFAVRTTTSTGEPVETDVHYRLFNDDNELSYSNSTRTDSQGNGNFNVPLSQVENMARIEVAAGSSNDFFSRPFEVSDATLATYLRIDKPLCRPGETVNYRSLTLSRFGLRVDAEADVRYFVADPEGKPIESSVDTNPTEKGVAFSSFVIPDDVTDGSYAVVAQSPSQKFPEEWQEFEVRRYRAPTFKKTLELARDSYTEGDTVEADFKASYVDGVALADANLKIQATFDGKPQTLAEAKTDKKGSAKLTIPVPEKVASARGVLSVTVEDEKGVAETITEDVRINLGKVNVEFYPEGGKLASQLDNRVYFYARDPLGKPLHIEGHIVDSADEVVAEVATQHEGRGVFRLKPDPAAQLWLEVEKPVGMTNRVELPAASSDQFVTLQTGWGVFEAEEPIALQIATTQTSKPLVVAAYCRGAMVGQINVAATDYDVSNAPIGTLKTELPLVAAAQGVIRVTAFDRSVTPVMPVAERLVYRRPGKQLNVRLSGQQPAYTAGDSVELEVAVTDEADSPTAAIAGVSVVDDAILTLGNDKSARMPTYFHLLTDIENPQDLEDANFYLSDDEGATEALDLLLGTQGWRRFIEVPFEQFAAGDMGGSQDPSLFSRNVGRQELEQVTLAIRDEAPFVAEVQSEPIEIAKQPLYMTSPSPKPSSFTAGVILLIGGPSLLLFVGALVVTRVGAKPLLTLPAGAVAVTALVLGIIWTSGRTEVAADAAVELVAAEEQADLALDLEAGAEAFAGAAAPAQAMNQDKANAAGFAADVEMIAEPTAAAMEAPPPRPAPREARAPKVVAADSPPSEAAGATAESAPAPAEPAAEAEMPDSSRSRFRIDDLKRLSKFQRESRGRVGRRLMRQYAKDFDGFVSKDVKKGDAQESTVTLHWDPNLVIDESGKSTIGFALPAKAATYRVIVEVHGAERLGAAETLIISRPAE